MRSNNISHLRFKAFEYASGLFAVRFAKNSSIFSFVIGNDDIAKVLYIARLLGKYGELSEEIDNLIEYVSSLLLKRTGLHIDTLSKFQFYPYDSTRDIPGNDGYLKLDSFGNLQIFHSCLFIPKYVDRLGTTGFIHIYNSRETQKDRSENSEKGKENGCYYGRYFLRRVFTHVTAGEKLHIDMCVNDISSVKDRISEMIRNRKFTDIVLFLEMDETEAMELSNDLEFWYDKNLVGFVNMRIELVNGDQFREKYNRNMAYDYSFANPCSSNNYNIEIKLPKKLFESESFKKFEEIL